MSVMIPVVVVILLTTIAVYLFLCSIWQKKLKIELKVMGEQLREMEQKSHRLFSLRRSFDTYKEESFVTSLMDIDDTLEKIRTEIRNKFETYIQYRGWQTRLDTSPWWDIHSRWNLIVLQRLQQSCVEGMEKNRALESQIEQVQARFDQIREFPWSIALQARELMEYLQQVKALLSELATFGLYGEAYTAIVDRLHEIEEGAKKIPLYFLTDPYDELVTEASQEDVRDVYQIIQTGLPTVVGMIQQTAHWKDQYLALENQNELAWKELDRLHQILSSMPDEIDLAAQRSKYHEWKTRLQALDGRRKNLTVDEMNHLADEISHLIHDIQSTQQFSRHSRHSLFEYQRFMHSNKGLITRIQQRFDSISPANFEINWDVSGPAFQHLYEIYHALLSSDKPYLPQVLERFVEQASLLHNRLLEVDKQTANVAAMYHTCEKMLESPEIKNAKQWIESAQNLANAIRPYDARNWPNREEVLSFEKNLQELETNFQFLNEKLSEQTLSESAIEDLSHSIEQVYGQSVSFREQMNVIEQVYRNLVNSEQNSLALLKTVRNQFAQITLFVLSQPLLAERAEKEIVQIDRRFDLCEVSFRQREKETLARKQTRLQQLISDVEQAANRWMSIVENDCLKLLSDLERRVERLEQIAALQDSLFYRAKELLARKDEIFNFRRTARVNIPMDQLVGSMKMVFDTWQEGFALIKQLGEQVESPVMSLYQEFDTLRRNAQTKYLEIDKLIPVQRKWPPNSLFLTVERNEMAQLEEKWQQLQSQPTSVIQFIRTLSDLVGSYRSMLEKLLQYEQWAIQEQARIERLEADIQRLDRLWEIQQHRYGQVPEIGGQIQDLRQKAAQELLSLRQYWLSNASRRPPSVDYDVVLRRLIELSRHLANARIIIVNEDGQQEMMDINGQVIRKI